MKLETIIKAAEYARNIPDRYWNIKDTERLINSIYRDLYLMDITPEGLKAAFHFSSDKKEMLKLMQDDVWKLYLNKHLKMNGLKDLVIDSK